jgi:hypothetical protein
VALYSRRKENEGNRVDVDVGDTREYGDEAMRRVQKSKGIQGIC